MPLNKKESIMSKRAIVVVDLQNDYWPSGKWPLMGIEEAAANAAKVIEKARAEGDIVIHVRHESTTPDAPFFVPGTDGVQINSVVQPVGTETVRTDAGISDAFGSSILRASRPVHSSKLHHLFSRLSLF
jgi:nicotinamidase-related amidase